jgi:hypothetical protein
LAPGVYPDVSLAAARKKPDDARENWQRDSTLATSSLDKRAAM